MITSTGEVRVLDFGFARHRPLDLHSASTFDAAPASAPAYASVERVNGSEPHPSDDVYSLACIAYELLSGEHPFGGRSAVLARANGRRPRNIAGLTRKQMQSLNRALLWGRGERKIDVVDLLGGPRLLRSAEQAGAAGRARCARRHAVSGVVARSGMLVFTLMVGAAAAAFVYLERNPVPQRPAAAPAATPVTSAGSSTPRRCGRRQAKSLAKAPPAAVKPRKRNRRQRGAEERREARCNRRHVRTPLPSTRPVVIEFDKDTYVATESDGSVRIVVERHGSTQQPVSFRWSLRSNSAEQGTDFAGIGPDTEQIPAGARAATLTIPLVSDAIVENTEVFLVEIEPAQSGVTLGERSHAAVIIVDDD